MSRLKKQTLVIHRIDFVALVFSYVLLELKLRLRGLALVRPATSLKKL